MCTALGREHDFQKTTGFHKDRHETAISGLSWAVLRRLGPVLRRLAPSCAVLRRLGPVLRRLAPSWAVFETVLSGLGLPWCSLGACCSFEKPESPKTKQNFQFFKVFGPKLEPAWGCFEPVLGRLGLVLGRLGPVLGRLGPVLGHLGPILEDLGPSRAI